MYGIQAYKYRQPIQALPQLPTVNARLKPPGLSGCSACGMGAVDNTSTRNLILAVGAGILLVTLLASKK
jgi:hypothetical protein